MTAVDPRARAERVPRARRSAGQVARALVALMKLRIVELLLVTTLPVMVLAQRGLPPPALVVATLLGGTLAAGSAHAYNQVLERDIDVLMRRTAARPLASGVVTPREATVFATVLLLAAVAVMLVWVNPLAAALTVLANAFYVIVYTMLLKRRTPQNIVWGGIAGCMPTLIGWVAVTGRLDWPPFLLFLVVFFWTPPHYWPLAMKFRDDYVRAGVPMLPVVAGDRATARQVILYAWAMLAVSLLVWPVAGTGWLYPVVAALAGAWFLGETYRMRARALAGLHGAALRPMRLFHGSITYLSLVFAAVALDPLLLR